MQINYLQSTSDGESQEKWNLIQFVHIEQQVLIQYSGTPLSAILDQTKQVEKEKKLV